MVWYSHLLKNFRQFVVIHTVKGFAIVNKTEVDDFLELSCFFDDPVDVGNLIPGSSAFSKSSLNVWEFTVHILLKPGLSNFEHTFLVCEMNAIVQEFERSLALPFSGLDERSNPTSKEWRLSGHRRAERSYSMFKVRRGGCEEIPLVQGKEQQLCFAGAAVKRYPTSKVRETQVRR